MNKKRKYKRIPEHLEARWEGRSGLHDARVNNVSLGGCYFDTDGPVTPGEVINFNMHLPTGNWLSLRGEVRYYQPGAGFGVQFWPMKRAEWELWLAFLALIDEEEVAVS